MKRTRSCLTLLALLVPTLLGASAQSDDLASFQRDFLARLTGEAEVRPGVKITNRFEPDNKREARDFIVSTLTKIGLDPKRHDYSPEGENIYATLGSDGGQTGVRPPSDPRLTPVGPPSDPGLTPTIIVGAHYDSRTGPGANDDGTGVAAVIGAARELAKVPNRKRAILFVLFDQEERGLVGSAAFARMVKDEGRLNVHSVHTIDQIGWDANHNRAIELENPYEGAVDLYKQAAARLKMDVPIWETNENGSDHTSFRRLGFKAIGITEEYRHGDTTPYIHKLGDTFATVDSRVHDGDDEAAGRSTPRPRAVSAVLIETLSADAFVAAQDDLVHLLRACVDGGASVGFMSPMPTADAAAYWRSVEPQIQSGTRIVLVARESAGGRIVGTGQLVPTAFPNGRHRAEVAKVLVLPSHRRQGVATRIMYALEDHARASGRWLLHLDTTEGASGATGLYESLGYTMAGGIPEWARDPDGPLQTTIFYFKKLTGPPAI